MSNPATSLPPGFRFHPTDEELILHYLRKRAASLPCPVSIIAEVDIYKFDPWELPAKSLFGEREWYFFSPRDRKYPNGIRPNRAAASGYWKATGTDKAIVASKGSENIGVKKALVFYKGRPPKGVKTEWIMHEYRLAEAHKSNNYRPMKLKDASMRLDDWVLCRIYRKSTHHASADAEPEDSSVDDVLVPNPSINAETHGNAFMKLPKSCSLTELLDAVDGSALARLLENPSDMIGLENCPVGYPFVTQPFCSNSNSSFNNEKNYLVPVATQVESPVPITENRLKRQKPAESVHSGDLPRPPKKPMDSMMLTDFTNRIDGAQFNLMSHPFFNHHLVMNSHLGSQ